jgi:hypothetical protein
MDAPRRACSRKSPHRACRTRLSQGSSGRCREPLNVISQSVVNLLLCHADFYILHGKLNDRNLLENFEVMARPKRFELLTPRFVVWRSERWFVATALRCEVGQQILAVPIAARVAAFKNTRSGWQRKTSPHHSRRPCRRATCAPRENAGSATCANGVVGDGSRAVAKKHRRKESP